MDADLLPHFFTWAGQQLHKGWDSTCHDKYLVQEVDWNSTLFHDNSRMIGRSTCNIGESPRSFKLHSQHEIIMRPPAESDLRTQQRNRDVST
jgi:hypothetical protein